MQAQPKNVSEVGFTFQNRTEGQSKFSVREQYEYLMHLFSLMRRSGELIRAEKFVLVGGSGILLNEGLLWLLTAHTGLDYRLANAMSIEASIISNFIFNNYFTFADRRNSGSRVFFISLGRFELGQSGRGRDKSGHYDHLASGRRFAHPSCKLDWYCPGNRLELPC